MGYLEEGGFGIHEQFGYLPFLGVFIVFLQVLFHLLLESPQAHNFMLAVPLVHAF